MSVTAEVKRMMWKSAAEYHEQHAHRCKSMTNLDQHGADVAALAIDVHTAMAEFARAELEKVKP